MGIRELSVYSYKEGDSKANEEIPELPTRQILKAGSGSMFQEKCITKRTNFQHSLMKRILKHLLTQTVGGHQQWCRHLVTYLCYTT